MKFAFECEFFKTFSSQTRKRRNNLNRSKSNPYPIANIMNNNIPKIHELPKPNSAPGVVSNFQTPSVFTPQLPIENNNFNMFQHQNQNGI